MDYPQDDIVYWSGSAVPFSGSTAFGYFDNDSLLTSESSKIAVYIANQLGYPANDIELTPEMININIESALMEYSNIINEFNIEESYFDIIGQPTETNFSNVLVKPNIRYWLKVAEDYGIESFGNVGATLHTGSIDIVANQQVYDMKEYFNTISTSSVFVIRKIFHNRIPPLSYTQLSNPVATNYMIPNGILQGFSPNDSTGYGSQVLLPISQNATHKYATKLNREINLSEYSFQLNGHQLRIFPIPRRDYKLYFHYTKSDDLDESLLETSDTDVINSPHKVNYDFIQWSKITNKDKVWVIKYALALCKINLGLVRRKYSSIPYPNGEISLDGDSLVSEGQITVETLTQQLKDSLNKMSKEQGNEIKRRQIENNIAIMNGAPLGLYKI